MELVDEWSNIYFFEQSKICVKAYSELTGVSTYILNVVRSNFNQGRSAPYEHSNKGKGRMTVAGTNLIAWMLDLVKIMLRTLQMSNY